MEYKISNREKVQSYLPEDTDEELFKEYTEQDHLQIIKLPDLEYSDADLNKYMLVRRKPQEIRDRGDERYAISKVKRSYGDFSLSEAISEALLLNDQADFPLHKDCLILRPKDFEDHEFWLSCPHCEDESEIDTELHIQEGKERSYLEVKCTSCETKVDNESDGRAALAEWAHCPICSSTDINYECSIPYGFVNFSCDDCNYDTKPSKTDVGFSELDVDF